MYINVKAVRVLKSDSIFGWFFFLPSHKLISLIFNIDFFALCVSASTEEVVNNFSFTALFDFPFLVLCRGHDTFKGGYMKCFRSCLC